MSLGSALNSLVDVFPHLHTSLCVRLVTCSNGFRGASRKLGPSYRYSDATPEADRGGAPDAPVLDTRPFLLGGSLDKQLYSPSGLSIASWEPPGGDSGRLGIVEARHCHPVGTSAGAKAPGNPEEGCAIRRGVGEVCTGVSSDADTLLWDEGQLMPNHCWENVRHCSYLFEPKLMMISIFLRSYWTREIFGDTLTAILRA